MTRYVEYKLLEGDPIRAGGRMYVPLVRLAALRLVGGSAEAGGGLLLGRLWPVALAERREGQEISRIPIRDETGNLVRLMIMAGFIFWLILRMARKGASRGTKRNPRHDRQA